MGVTRRSGPKGESVSKDSKRAPRASNAFIISRESRECNGACTTDGESAMAASRRYLLVSDLDPGIRTVARAPGSPVNRGAASHPVLPRVNGCRITHMYPHNLINRRRGISHNGWAAATPPTILPGTRLWVPPRNSTTRYYAVAQNSSIYPISLVFNASGACCAHELLILARTSSSRFLASAQCAQLSRCSCN